MLKHYVIPDVCKECGDATPRHLLIEPKPLSTHLSMEALFVCDDCFFATHMRIIEAWNRVVTRRTDKAPTVFPV